VTSINSGEPIVFNAGEFLRERWAQIWRRAEGKPARSFIRDFPDGARSVVVAVSSLDLGRLASSGFGSARSLSGEG